MKQIRAFVAHSFTEDDAEVVGKFVRFFDQLSASHAHFSWQHAEPAEPKVLEDKVLDLLADKSVFIGICMKKERVIAPCALRPVPFFLQFLESKGRRFLMENIRLDYSGDRPCERAKSLFAAPC